MIRLITTAFVLIFSSTVAFTQIVNDVEALVEQHWKEQEFSGTVLVAKNGITLYDKSYGYSNEELKTPITKETKFSLASIGKMLTAVIIMKLIDEGKMDMHTPVDQYLPEWKIPNGSIITPHHLLTHSSGLGDYMNTEEHLKIKGSQSSIDQLMKIVCAQPLRNDKPGTRFQYCNSGFIVLGKIIEKIEKKSYPKVLEDRIFKPSGIRNASFAINLNKPVGYANGYVKNNSDQWEKNGSIIPPSSDGGLFATAYELFLFDQALFKGKLISSESLEKMKTKQFGPAGYSTIITPLSNGIGYGHNGGLPGYQAEYRHFYIKGDEYTVIILANHDMKAMSMFMDMLPILEKL